MDYITSRTWDDIYMFLHESRIEQTELVLCTTACRTNSYYWKYLDVLSAGAEVYYLYDIFHRFLVAYPFAYAKLVERVKDMYYLCHIVLFR